ncbi:hypothetical protein ABIC42_001112 [Variovorax sp. 1133]|jgi:hypothetical protein
MGSEGGARRREAGESMIAANLGDIEDEFSISGRSHIDSEEMRIPRN